jgi:hypothetical protein
MAAEARLVAARRLSGSAFPRTQAQLAPMPDGSTTTLVPMGVLS